jgi:hypothetical protein
VNNREFYDNFVPFLFYSNKKKNTYNNYTDDDQNTTLTLPEFLQFRNDNNSLNITYDLQSAILELIYHYKDHTRNHVVTCFKCYGIKFIYNSNSAKSLKIDWSNKKLLYAYAESEVSDKDELEKINLHFDVSLYQHETYYQAKITK